MSKVLKQNQLKTNFINHKLKFFSSTHRKAETRTKIQLGGLIFKSGLCDILDINPGDDMQTYDVNLEKASVILGALLEAVDQYDLKKDDWKIVGRKHLKYQFLQNQVDNLNKKERL